MMNGNSGKREQLTTSVSDSRCTVCRRPRASLRPRKSKLKPDMLMFLCNECFDGKREPRFLIILVARSKGVSAVRDHIRNHKYYGDKIVAEELI